MRKKSFMDVCQHPPLHLGSIGQHWWPCASTFMPIYQHFKSIGGLRELGTVVRPACGMHPGDAMRIATRQPPGVFIFAFARSRALSKTTPGMDCKIENAA